MASGIEEVGGPGRWTRSMRIALAGFMVAGLALGWLARPAEISLGGDEATYITLSRSLDAGRYRDEFLVGTPPHAQYPPGNPAWLLVVRHVLGRNVDAARAANLLLLACVALLLADALRRVGLPWLGVAAAAATMLNPPLLGFAASALSEIPYLTLTAVALWATLATSPRSGRPRQVLASIAAAGAFLTRLAGLATLGAVTWSALLRREWARLAAALAGMGVVVLAWVWYARTAARAAVGQTYANDISLLPSGIRAVIAHAVANADEFIRRTPVAQFGFPDIPGTRLDTPIFAALLMIPALAGLPRLARRWPAAAMFLVLSTGLLLMWPWAHARLMTPIVPWMIVAILFGAERIATAFHLGGPQRYGLAAAAVLVGCGTVAQARAAVRGQACRHAAPYHDARCYTESERGFVTAARFIRDSMPPQAVVATSNPATLSEFSGHQTAPLETAFVVSAEGTLTIRGPATELLLSRMEPDEDSGTATALLAGCRHLDLRGQFAPGIMLFSPRATAEAHDSTSACMALARLVRPSPTDASHADL